MSDQSLLDALRANTQLIQEIALQYGVATGVAAPAPGGAITTPEKVVELCADMPALLQEQLRVLLLNQKSELVSTITIYQGTVNSASIRVAEILRPAIVANAPAFILVHNHPSGDPEPSGSDLAVTRKVLAAADHHDIDVYDHVVIGRAGKFVSMKQRGLGGYS